MTTNARPEGLCLRIDRQVEVKCKYCNPPGSGKCDYAHMVDDLMVDGGQREVTTRDDCVTCSGTGLRTRRLRGDVEVEEAIDAASCCCDSDAPGVKVILPEGKFKGRKWLEGPNQSECLRGLIVAAHVSGTLPPELYASADRPWGLRETEVDNE